jgi:nucleoside-diphosphate-sugar epimerase
MAMNSQILSKEQVLIVGCGDIGQRLAHCLRSEIYSVTGLRRHPPADTDVLRYHSCDVTDRVQLAQVLEQDFSMIIISMTPGERSDVGYQQAYVQTCENLVAELKAKKRQPGLILFVSSSAVYNQMDGGWVDEMSPTEPDGFSGKRLLDAEKVIQASGFPNTIVRFSGIYGPGRNRLIEQVRQGRASNSPHFTNRIHADDCAGVIAHLLELRHQNIPLAPVYLASDCTPAPMLEVVSWLAAQLGVTEFLAEDVANERGNKRCSNQRLLASGFRFRYPGFKDGYSLMLASLK